MHDLLVIAIPTLAVMSGVLLNGQYATAVRSELKTEIGQLRSEIITLRDNIHQDMVGLHERIATVEARQKS